MPAYTPLPVSRFGPQSVRRLRDFLARRRILLSLGALFSGSAVARLLSALTIFVLARQLGIERFGIHAATLALAKLSSVLFSLGLDSWLLREGRRSPQGFPAAIGTSLMLKLVLGLLWLLLLGAIAPFLNQTSFPTVLVVLAAVSIVLEELALTTASAFKASLRNRVTVWLVMIAPAVLLLLTIFLSWRNVIAIGPYFAARIVSFVLAGAAGLYLVWRMFGLEVKWGWMSDILRETRPYGVSQGLALIYERADLTIIAFVLGTAAAGIYAPAVSLMTTLFLIPLAVYEVMLPLISTLHARNHDEVRRPAFRFVLFSAALGVLMGVGLAVIAHPLVWLLYGPEFAASGAILTILSSVLVFKTVSFALAAVIAAVGWQGQRAIIQAVTALLSIVLTLAVIGRYGIHGVAHVYVFTEFLVMSGYMVLLLRWQHKHLGKSAPASIS